MANSFDSRLAPLSPRPEAAAGRIAVRQRLLDIGDARTLIVKVSRTPRRAPSRRARA